MKRLLVCMGLFVATAATLSAQKAPASPAATETTVLAGKTVSITYNSPGVKGRAGHLFGKDGKIGQDPTYPVWRAGANAATKLHTDADLEIAGLKVPKGDYTLYVDVSDAAKWVLIVNKQVGQWGTVYDKAQDLGRVPMSMSTPPLMVENLKYAFSEAGAGKHALTLCWENVCASVSIAAR